MSTPGASRVAAVAWPAGGRTHTVVGADGFPVAPIEEFLAYLRAGEVSPHTLKAYCYGLANWWTLLADLDADWTAPPADAVGQFLGYLRTGDLPSVRRVGVEPSWLAPRSRSLRLAAVHAFYDWAAAAHGVPGIPQGARRLSRGGRYRPMLTGVGPDPTPPARLYRVRQPAGRRPPVLSPGQVQLILQLAGAGDDGVLTRARRARDRLLFALLIETGMRLGEALSLRHLDVHAGQGQTPFIAVTARQDHPHGARVKNSKDRTLYIGDDLEGAYSAYVWSLIDAGIDLDVPDLSDHFVFVNCARAPLWRPLRPESVYDVVDRITRAAGDDLPPGWTPHWLRHTHATALLLAGCPPHVVMRRLGHADIQTTLGTYGWVTEDAAMRSLADWTTFTAGWRDLT